jgi:ATP-dependent Zn protease
MKNHIIFAFSIFSLLHAGEKPAAVQEKMEIQPGPSQAEPSYVHIPQKLPHEGLATVKGVLPLSIRRFIDFIKSPEKYNRMGAQLSKGILLVGKPGTGKTSIARAIAEEAQIPFIRAVASNFEGPSSGTGQANIRKLFETVRAQAQASTHKKALLFIDELDALGSRDKMSELNPWYHQDILTMCTEIDELDNFKEKIFLVGASNNTANIDPALKRSGRFGTITEVSLPRFNDRLEILQFYATGTRYNKISINFNKIASLTKDFTPADLKELVNEAALEAVAAGADNIMLIHYMKALKRMKERRNELNTHYLK